MLSFIFNKKTKKSLTNFIGGVLIAVFLLLPASNALATIPVVDYGAIGQRKLTETLLQMYNIKTPEPHFWSDLAFKIGQFAHNFSMEIKEYILDGLFWTMANVVIDQFGDAMVDWIRNGFEGSPMFLSDPEGFFRDTANQASGAIIDDLDMEWLCDPLGKLRLDLNFFFPGTDRAKYRCTFNDIAGNFKNIAGRKDLSDWADFNVNVHQQNIVRLYGYDYRHGGFLMWLTTAQKKNNDLGRTIQTANDAYAAASIRIGTNKFSLLSAGGFFGVKKCVEWSDGREKGGPRVIDEKAKCLKHIDTTPGQLVQDQLNQSANGSLDRLKIADEIDEIIGALATTMLGWMLTGGNDGGGVLAYDKDADYSASNRDHFGELEKSREVTQGIADAGKNSSTAMEWEKTYAGIVNRRWGDLSSSLLGTESNLKTIKSKMECIKSVNKDSEIKAKSVCGAYYEGLQDVVLDSGQKAIIDNDIEKINGEILSIQNTYDKYNEVITYSDIAVGLIGEYQKKVSSAMTVDEINSLKTEYCYESGITGAVTVCIGGVAGVSENVPVAHIGSDINPIGFAFGGKSTTTANIYWYSANADYCTPGGGEDNWLENGTAKNGVYTTTTFNVGEARKYSVDCSSGKIKTGDTVSVQQDSVSVSTPIANVSLFAEPPLVKIGNIVKIYWLSTNVKNEQCYLFSPTDPLKGGNYHSQSSSSNRWWYAGEGYYSKVNPNNIDGKETFNLAVNTDYALACQDYKGKSVVAKITIKIFSSEEAKNVKYTTHTESHAQTIDNEINAIIANMNNKNKYYEAMLVDYTKTRKEILYMGGY